MSTRRNPPQRLSPEVYRRRRIVVFTILLLLLGGIGYGAWALKNYLSGPAESAPPVAEETGPSAEELANPKECLASALEVIPSFAADSVPVGQTASISVLVRNTGDVPCLIDASKSTVHAFITSGNDNIWASDHCGAGLPESRRLLLDVGASDTTVISWPGTRSAAGCASDQGETKPGTYRLNVKVDAADETISEEIVFGMH